MSDFSFVPDGYELDEGRELTEEEKSKVYIPEAMAQSEFKEDAPFIKEHLRSMGDEGLDYAVRLDRGNIDWMLQEFKGMSPEEVKMFHQIHTKDGIPHDVMRQDKETWKKYKKVEDLYNQFMQRDDKGELKFPYTAQALVNPDKFIRLKDDVKALQELEGIIIAHNRSTMRVLYEAFKEGTKGLGYNVLSTLKSYRMENLQKEKEELENLKKKFPEAKGLHDSYKRQIDKGLGIIKNLEEWQQSDILRPKNIPESSSSFEQFLRDFVGVLPQFLGTIGTTLATKSPKAGMAFMYPQIHGQTYDQLTTEGVSHNNALKASWRNALAQSLIEGVPVAGWMKALKGPVGRSYRAIVVDFMQAMVKESGAEFLQAFPDEFSKEYARLTDKGMETNLAIKETLKKAPEAAMQGLYEALVMAPMGFLGGAGTLARNYAGMKQAQKELKFFDDEVNAIRESDLLKKSYEEYQDFAEEVHEHYDVNKEVYISKKDMQSLYQDNVPEMNKKLEELGVSEQDMVEAEVTGEYKIDRSRFIHEFASSEMYESIKDKIRFTPDTMTVEEANNIRDDFAIELKQIEQEVREQVKENTLPKQASTIRTQLIKEFGMSAEDANANIALMIAGAKRRAKETGETLD